MGQFRIPYQILSKKNKNEITMTTQNWFAVFGASLAAFMAVLDIQVSNASLREIQGTLGLELTEGGWISTAYLIAETIMIPLTGYFSATFGIRRFILWNCALFIFSSILCGLSWNLESMILFRCLQGFSGGALVPLAFQVLLIYIPTEKRHLSMVIFGLTATLAPTIGPSLGGWLTENFGWRHIFFINIFPGILMIYLISKGIEKAKIDWEKLKKIDISGAISLSIGLGTLIYILEEGAKKNWFEDFHIQIATLISMTTLVTFIILQLLKKNPLLDLYSLTERNFLMTSVITMISGAALYGGIYSISIYLGQVQNYQASEIGKIIMWLGVPQLLVMPLLPFLMQKINLKLLISIGILIFAYSNYMNAFMDYQYAGNQVRFSLFLRAIGQPLFMIPVSVIGMSLVDKNSAGNASAIFNMLRNIGGSIGVSIAGTFLISRQKLHEYEYNQLLKNGGSEINEYLYRTEKVIQSSGLDTGNTKSLAIHSLKITSLRDSYIQAFNDIFFTLGMSLGLLCFFIFLMKTNNKNRKEEVIFE